MSQLVAVECAGNRDNFFREEERCVSPQLPPAAASSPTSLAPIHPPLVHIQFYDNDHSQLVQLLVGRYKISHSKGAPYCYWVKSICYGHNML